MNDDLISLEMTQSKSSKILRTFIKNSFISNTSCVLELINSRLDNSSFYDCQNKAHDNISFKEKIENLSDSLEETNKSDSEINLNLYNSITNTNDTIIIHNNKITLDDIIEKEDLKHYLSTSTNHNSEFTVSIQNKINNYLNYMDYRGNQKNQKNLVKRINNCLNNNHNEYKRKENKKDNTSKRERKSNSDIFLRHRKILSNILTSKEFLKKSNKKNKEIRSNSDLDKTICDIEYKQYNVIDEESNEDIVDDKEELMFDLNENCCDVNKVKDFQEEYLKGGVRFISDINKQNINDTCDKTDKKFKKAINDDETDKDEDKDSFDVFKNVLKDANNCLISGKNDENNKRMFNKRLFNLQRNKNLFTFNPKKVTSKLTEQKIISLIEYNLENKESGGK